MSKSNMMLLALTEPNPLCEKVLWAKGAMMFNTETTYDLYYRTPLKRLLSMCLMIDAQLKALSAKMKETHGKSKAK